MTRVILDEALRSKLHNLAEPLELCDESGRVLGHLYPEYDLSKYEQWEPPMSEEEFRRLVQSNEPCYTTAEVLACLKEAESSFASSATEGSMTRVIMDDTLRSRLHNLTEPLELYDESGRVLGRVIPTVDL